MILQSLLFGENDKNEITEEDNYLKDFSLKNNVVGDYSENENANTNFHFKESNSFDKKIEYVPIRCTIFQRDQKDRKYNSNMNENPPNKINYILYFKLNEICLWKRQIVILLKDLKQPMKIFVNV